MIVPVPKKRRKGTCEVDDFRGIALGSVVYKVMCSIVQQRMTQMVEAGNNREVNRKGM